MMGDKTISILLIEDNPDALEACLRAQKQGIPLVVADPGLPASARLTQLAEWLMAQRPLPAKAP